jgi:hypothetical protein
MTRSLFATAVRNVLMGGVAWLVLLPFTFSDSFHGELIQRVLLLGVLVIVPLGLALISSAFESRSFFFSAAVVSQPLGALAVVISAALDPGLVAACFAAAWMVVTGLIALDGLLRLPRLRTSGRPVMANLVLIAGMIYLPVGSVWLVMSRLGIQPLGFGDTIVLLTAVHFHFSGFAAPLLAGLTGCHLPSSARAHALLVITGICVIVGTPLVAAGITASPVIALVGATVISGGLFCLALLNLGWIVPGLAPLPKVLLVVSSLASIPAMALACIYAYSIVFHKLIVDIPRMAMTHGIANSFGFALCGLTAWAILARTSDQPANAGGSVKRGA